MHAMHVALKALRERLCQVRCLSKTGRLQKAPLCKSIEHWVNWVNRWHFVSTDSGNTCQTLSPGLGPWFFRSLDWVDYILQSWTLGLVFCLRRFRQSESQSSCATMLRKTYSLSQNQSQTRQTLKENENRALALQLPVPHRNGIR